MWNPKDDDDSWEVRAFEEDTGNSMGATWPPRFYTCTFCRREFRSAQALGGHMNVHRRDRVRLNQTPSNTSLTTFPNANSNLQVQNQGFLPNGGLCLVYSSMPNYNPNYGTIKSSSTVDSPSNNLFSNTISPFLMMSSPSSNFHVNQQPHNNNNIIISSSSSNNSTSNDNNRDNGKDEIDLELRLGWRSISNTTKMTGYKV